MLKCALLKIILMYYYLEHNKSTFFIIKTLREVYSKTYLISSKNTNLNNFEIFNLILIFLINIKNTKIKILIVTGT